jgi:hypothetical protein
MSNGPDDATWPGTLGAAVRSGPSAKPVAGWYEDPWDRAQHRFWDGQSWTAETFPNGPPRTDVSSWSTPAWGAAMPEAEDVDAGAPPEAGEDESVWSTPSEATIPPPEWAPEPTPKWTMPPPAPVPSAEGPARTWLPTGRALVVTALVVGLVVGFLAAVGIVTAVDHDHQPNSNAFGFTPQPTTPVPGNGGLLPVTPAQPTPTTPAQPIPTTPGNPGAGTTPGPVNSALNSIVIRQSDVPTTVTVVTESGDDSVAGAPTLDLCNATFPSESLRTARLQPTAVDDQGSPLISTEAVLYSSPAATAQAFAELRSAAAKCPATPVSSPVGDPTVATRFNAAPDASWPQTPTVERLAFDFVVTSASGQSQHFLSVFLRRGQVLEGLYFYQPDGAQVPVTGQTTMAGIVGVFAGRIAQLPASAVGG